MEFNREHIDLEGIELIENLYRKNDSREANMIRALCKHLRRALKQVVALREDAGQRKKLKYDGNEE